MLLAFLLLTEAQLWILDEPLTALDVEGVELVESMEIPDEIKERALEYIEAAHEG